MENKHVSLRELFCGFNQIALSGFGGVLPWARIVIVEKRAWLSSDEFTSLLGLCQFLPGPNIVNLSICVGTRFHGVRGAVTAFSGLLILPFFMIIAFGALYDRFGSIPLVHSILRGISAVAAGLILSTGLKMANDLRKQPLMLAFCCLIPIGIAGLGWPMLPIMVCLTPISIWAAVRSYRPQQ